jgi:2-polyprenyl-6-methoxyphenol hydroxylase-like FAD-dependent oxidoreductase
LLEVYTPKQLIENAISKDDFFEIATDLDIIHVGRWKLQAQLADKMCHEKVFLAGDTAHTYTPAGGFGMNCGFQDVNQLVHSLHLLERNPKASV